METSKRDRTELTHNSEDVTCEQALEAVQVVIVYQDARVISHADIIGFSRCVLNYASP